MLENVRPAPCGQNTMSCPAGVAVERITVFAPLPRIVMLSPLIGTAHEKPFFPLTNVFRRNTPAPKKTTPPPAASAACTARLMAAVSSVAPSPAAPYVRTSNVGATAVPVGDDGVAELLTAARAAGEFSTTAPASSAAPPLRKRRRLTVADSLSNRDCPRLIDGFPLLRPVRPVASDRFVGSVTIRIERVMAPWPIRAISVHIC